MKMKSLQMLWNAISVLLILFISGIGKVNAQKDRIADNTTLFMLQNMDSINKVEQQNRDVFLYTMEATNISFTSATLNGYHTGSVLTNALCLFEYGTTEDYGSVSDHEIITSISGDFSMDVSGLEPNTLYHFRFACINNGTVYYGGDQTVFTHPNLQFNNPTPYHFQNNVDRYPTLSWNIVNPYGIITNQVLYIHTIDNLQESSYEVDMSTQLQVDFLLNPNQEYVWRIVGYTSGNESIYGPLWHFTTNGTSANYDPVVVIQSPIVGSVSATLRGSVNPQGVQTNYYFEYGTTSNYGTQYGAGVLPASYSSQTVTTTIPGLQPNTQYHYRLYAYNSLGGWAACSDQTFTTTDDPCYFSDIPTTGEVHDAAAFLCQRGVVTGDANANTWRPDDYITRGELSKAAFYGLYSDQNGVNVPGTLVTDYFPSIYPDLQDQSTYYYRAAKTLLYLEYGDGISPFDRDRSCFRPSLTISRHHVLKVLLETFNIQPAEYNSSNPFGNYYLPSQEGWGYAKKAYDLGILVLDGTSNPRPGDDCTRQEAFLFLYRILYKIDHNSLVKPVPNYDSYNPLESDFFVPLDLSPDVVNAIRGIEYGNFNYYEKNFFDIPGYMNLIFGISYNSYLTEMPDEFYPIKPMGKAWTHTYNMYMNLIRDENSSIKYCVFHMQDGSLLIYGLNDKQMYSLTEDNYYTLGPQRIDNPGNFTLKSRNQISYVFSPKGNMYYLTKIIDRNNNQITINYDQVDSQYRISSVTTLGRTLIFNYTSDNLLASVTDPSNRIVYFSYEETQNPLKQLASVVDAKNQTTHFHYGTLASEKGLLKEIQLPKGNYVYNDYKRRKLKSMSYVEITSQNVTHTDIAIAPDYENGTTVSSVTQKLNDNQGVTTNYTMNDKNRITHITDNCNTDVSYQYGVGYPYNPELITNKTDNKTGLQISYAYETSNGLPTSVTFSSGSESHTTMIEYNGFNDIRKYTDANGNETNYTYSTTGNLEGITDAMGNTTTIQNNSHGVPIRVTNPMGMSVEYDYNEYGNLDEISIPSLNLTATMLYDPVSRMTSKTDFANHTTSYTYDANDNLKTVTDANGKTTTYEYDANDNMIWIQNARGYKTNLTYDFNNDFLTQVEFQGHTRNYTYKKDGSLESFTDPNGNTFNYTYNNSGELISDGYASLGYNSNTGRLETVTKDGKAITYTYDAFSRISSVKYDNKTVSYTYDNTGNVKTIVYPGSKTVTYTYDALNRITAVKDWNNKTTSYFYRNDGQLDYYQYPNGVRTTISYDDSGRCNGISTKRNSGNGSVIAEYSFEFDNMGNHTSETFTEPFEAYPSISSESLTYSYNNANRLTSAGNLSFGYDYNGNTTSRTGRTYGYDTKDNLTSVSGDFSASYTYDGLGNRRSATRNGVTTKYVLNLLGNIPMVLMETDANGSAQHYYIYGPSGLISRIDANSNTRYYVYDSRGSTVAMTDATTSANVTHKYQYDDFGKLLQVEEDDENLYRYVGKYGVCYEDQALTFMRARYYDPEIGRFLSEDPIWNINLYPYAGSNPVMGIDPNGELFIDFACILVGGLDYALFGSDHPVLDVILSGTVTAIGIIAVVAGSPVVATVATIAGVVMTVGSLTCSLIEYHYDKKSARNAIETSRQVSNFCERAQHEAKREKRPTEAYQFDEEAYVWMHESKSGTANTLKHLFHEISAREDLSVEQKKKHYSNIFRIARLNMQ